METLLYTLAVIAVLIIVISIIMKVVFKRSLADIVTDWLAQFF